MQLGDTDYTPTRSGLKKWLELENLKAKIFDAAGNSLEFAQGIINYLSVALYIPTEKLEEVAKANGAKIAIKGFVRFETGEGIEKRQDDFAAEVAAMSKQS